MGGGGKFPVSIIALAGVVYFVGNRSKRLALRSKTWRFWVLSGLATGAPWVRSFRALKVGDGSKVIPVATLSFLLVGVFAAIFLQECPTDREWLGILLVGAGVVILGVER